MIAIAAAWLGSCGGDEDHSVSPPQPRLELLKAAGRTTGRTARLEVSVHTGSGAYELAGALASGKRGYRTCMHVRQTPSGGLEYLRGSEVWLGRRDGTHEVFVKSPIGNEHGCGRGGWFDDHPPTITLFEGEACQSYRAGCDGGGESLIHMILTALTQMRMGLRSVTMTRNRPGGGATYRANFDFRRFDRRPPVRDEDAWFLRPSFRATGVTPLTAAVDAAGYVRRLAFRVPGPLLGRSGRRADLKIEARFSRFGRFRAVPRVVATAIE